MKKQIAADVLDSLNDALSMGKEALIYASTPEALKRALIDMLMEISTVGDLLTLAGREEGESNATTTQVPYIDTIKLVRNTRLEGLGYWLNPVSSKTEQIHFLGLRDSKAIVDILETADRLSFKRARQ